MCMCACSVNNGDVSVSCIDRAGGRGRADIITSSAGTASGCGNAADVITSSLDSTGGRGRAVGVIASCVDTASGRDGIDVITSSLDGVRGGIIDVIVSAVAGRKRGNTCAGSDTTAVGRRDGVSGAADG